MKSLQAKLCWLNAKDLKENMMKNNMYMGKILTQVILKYNFHYNVKSNCTVESSR